jgi:hypothetical protein
MRRAIGLTVLVLLAGCSLFTSLEDYDGDGAGGGPDASPSDAPVGPSDADAPADGGESADGGPDRSARYRAAIMADSPIAYFRFEEESGTTTKDEVGTHVATLVFAPTLGAPGLFGGKGAIAFPVASKAHLTVSGDDLRYAGIASFTIEAWVFPVVFKDYQWILSTESEASPRSGWSIFTNAAATPAFENWPGNTRSLYVDNAPLILDKWQHLAFTYNGGVVTAYVDGGKKKTYPSTTPLPDVGTLTIGCRYGDGDVAQCLDGWRADEIAFYSAPLTEQRIGEHYALGAPK